jgi:hypothetical protein
MIFGCLTYGNITRSNRKAIEAHLILIENQHLYMVNLYNPVAGLMNASRLKDRLLNEWNQQNTTL